MNSANRRFLRNSYEYLSSKAKHHYFTKIQLQYSKNTVQNPFTVRMLENLRTSSYICYCLVNKKSRSSWACSWPTWPVNFYNPTFKLF